MDFIRTHVVMVVSKFGKSCVKLCNSAGQYLPQLCNRSCGTNWRIRANLHKKNCTPTCLVGWLCYLWG